MFVTPQKTIRYSVKNNGPGRNKWFKSINQSINLSIYQSINQSINHIEHRGGMISREGLVHSIPVLSPGYLLPSHWVPVLASTDLLPRPAE